MLVFIDDSGDPGFKVEKGLSLGTYFAYAKMLSYD